MFVHFDRYFPRGHTLRWVILGTPCIMFFFFWIFKIFVNFRHHNYFSTEKVSIKNWNDPIDIAWFSGHPVYWSEKKIGWCSRCYFVHTIYRNNYFLKVISFFGHPVDFFNFQNFLEFFSFWNLTARNFLSSVETTLLTVFILFFGHPVGMYTEAKKIFGCFHEGTISYRS